MSRKTFRVHLVTHHDGAQTGRLLALEPRDGSLSGYGKTDADVFAQLALAVEEHELSLVDYLWDGPVHTRTVRVAVHPQAIVKARHVIAAEEVSIKVAYAWMSLDRGGFRVLVPRFDWWFLLEDVEMAPSVIRQAVAAAMLGKKPRALYEFRGVVEERVLEWSPTLGRKPDRRLHPPRAVRTPNLHAVAEDLAARERRHKRPIVGDIDVENEVRLVTGERPRSLLVVGPPGCGKTTWVRILALRLARAGDERRTTVWATSADRIVSGMAYLGQWEQRCLEIVEELSTEGDILYVAELAPLCSPQSGRTSIADMFADAVAAGEVRLIAECTPEDHERLAATFPAFVGLFSVVRLHPPGSSALPSLLDTYQARLNPSIAFTGPALRQLVQQLEFFERSRSFPGKGFRFLDWLNRRKDSGVRPPEDEGVTTLGPIELSEAFAASTGLPLELISDAHVAGRDVIATRLRAGVIGQDRACAMAARVLTRFKTCVGDPERPIGSLFFVGPTGVGKTELAKQLARYMFGRADKMIRLDMSEFMVPGAAQRLLATGRGSESLVERVRRQPLSLVLLDEIEKAHPEVFDLLLAMLGEGRMTDTAGSFVDFRMTLVVMTSNLGVRERASPGFGSTGQTEDELIVAVRRHFRPEFFNRIDHVIPFRNLARADILQIVDLELAHVVAREGVRRRNLRLVADDEAKHALAEAGWHPTRGARPLKRVIEERVVTPLAALLAADPRVRDRTVRVRGDAVKVVKIELE